MNRILWLICVLSCAGLAAKPLPTLDLGGVTETEIWIPMRDGVRLYGILYRPPGQGKWPVIFELRFTEINGKPMRKVTAEKAQAGFAVANVVWRGSCESEGVYSGYRSLALGEHQDAYDVCEWLAAQPWSTGKVGSYGGSQGAVAQGFLAAGHPPHLVCQYMVDTSVNRFTDSQRLGGTTGPAHDSELSMTARSQTDYQAYLRLRDAHPNYDDYWRAEDCSLHFVEMDVPCFHLGSWYDHYQLELADIASFLGRQHHGGPHSRGHQQLVMGPWRHGKGTKSNHVEELVYPENAVWPELAHLTRWFNYWLKGEANGVMDESPVRYYVMGATGEPGAPGNLWRQANDWPPTAGSQRLYLRDSGGLDLTPTAAAGNRTSFTSDPLHPMELPDYETTKYSRARDARAFEQQRDVRTWTTEALTAPMEWTGEVKAEIWLSSTAPDTDLVVRLSDVYPDGRSMLIFDHPFRARYREGFDRQVLLIPGRPALLRWTVGATSIIFNRGHRVRVAIASSALPNYEPNSQTGGPQTADWLRNARVAENTIWHDATHPSCLVVPLMKGP